MRRRIAAVAAVGLGAGLLLVPGAALAAPGNVVISQVYGGGGNSGAPLSNDFVELYNRSGAAVDLAAYSVQYASATGTGLFSSNTTALSGVLEPGKYYLVKLAAGATPSGELPAADATGATNMSGTAGKVALVKSAEGLACNGGATLCDATQSALIEDLVGYGTANFFEGTPAPAASNTTALLRGAGGCTDTDVNSADFTAGAPAPRNGASPVGTCGGGDPDPDPEPTCDTPVTHQVADVQGTGTASPLTGQTVRVEGVVTGGFQGPARLGGFFIQDDTPDADAATSDGLFVFTTKPAAVGDKVKVTGQVAEFGGLTELTSVSVVDVCGTGTIAPVAYDLPRKVGATFEPLEGVLVTFPQKLTATEHFTLGRFGEIHVSAKGRLFQPTDREKVTQEENDRLRLLIDDGSTVQNPPVVPYMPVRLGDTITDLTGVMSQGFGAYRLQPTEHVDFTNANERRDEPDWVGGNVRVASFNTLNWFTTLDARGADTAVEQQRQLAKEVATLKGLDADIVGLMEVENNGDTAVGALVDALNAAVGAGTYTWVKHPSPGTDAIHVAMIYRPAKVKPVGTPFTIDDPLFERHPFGQTFERVGGSEQVSVIVNHFKSKSCGTATGDEADLGQGCWNARRKLQAAAIADLAKTVPNPLVIGDLNAYTEEDPIHILENSGLIGQAERYEPRSKRYSYVFNGQSGELDHVLAGSHLSRRITGLSIWHINADEPIVLDYNTEFNPPYLYQPDQYRSSDHDPVVVGINLRN